MESQVLQEDDIAIIGLVDDILNLLAHTIRSERDLLSTQELLKFWEDGLEGVFLVDLAIRTTQVGHEDHGFGTVVDGILDCWDRACDALRVGNFLVAVEWDIEVDLETVR